VKILNELQHPFFRARTLKLFGSFCWQHVCVWACVPFPISNFFEQEHLSFFEHYVDNMYAFEPESCFKFRKCERFSRIMVDKLWRKKTLQRRNL